MLHRTRDSTIGRDAACYGAAVTLCDVLRHVTQCREIMRYTVMREGLYCYVEHCSATTDLALRCRSYSLGGQRVFCIESQCTSTCYVALVELQLVHLNRLVVLRLGYGQTCIEL